MSRPFHEQIRAWAAKRRGLPLDTVTHVTMETEYDEGYACCGGTDPSCYCSLATSATLNLVVTIHRANADAVIEYVDLKYGDMGSLIQEIYEA